jgi:hypothetical protein
MSTVAITTPSGPLCMRGVRQIIVEEEMDHSLILRPVLDEMVFPASRHLGSVWAKLHRHQFSRICEELLKMSKEPWAPPSNILLEPAYIPSKLKTCQAREDCTALVSWLAAARRKHARIANCRARYGRAQLLNILHDMMGSRVDSRQREHCA